ncbi:zinc ribbon domain-containing protein [Desulforhopalus vacuolatus]|uniref:zinc ribbon domain-containing protein n=1 Tax=Desulforhopalus vacuolatus TaxID=40414 RepID=UPI0019664AE6|nr:zinc ribbon domain-containing protein [Desulforhopalus vacuolatus]MBM9519639.1 zinc ribbon domain-containing protein [Desulforhopalus vacuolatus]
MTNILRYLDEVKICPHCNQKLTACEAPPIHVGDGLGWGAEVLFICLNDECPVFVNGWDKIEEAYGHHASYRYMELPGSPEKNYMMVGNAGAFTGCIIDREKILSKNKQYIEQKKMMARLDTAAAEKDITAPLAILLDEGAAKDKRKQACDILIEIANLECIDPIRNHPFRDPSLESFAGLAVVAVLKKNFKKECPHCAEIIKAQAKKCKYCQGDV